MSKNYSDFETMMEKYAAAKEYLEPSAEAVQNLYQIPEGKIPKEKFHRTKRWTAYAVAAAVAVLVLGTVIYCTARLSGMGIETVTLEEVPEIGDISTIEVSEEEEVSFVVDEVLEDSAVFTLTNLSSRELHYGTEQILEKELDGTWYQVNTKVQCSWSDVGLELSSGGQDTETVDFGADSIYGELSTGHYRLIKRFEFFTRDENWVEYYEGEFYLACEFDIP